MADHNVDEIKVKVCVFGEEESLGKLEFEKDGMMGRVFCIHLILKIFRYLLSIMLFQNPACLQPQHWVI